MSAPKLAVATLAAIVVSSAAPGAARAQSAYSYRWCAVYPRSIGGYGCYYQSYDLCMKTMLGIGGYCMLSPFYRGPDAGTARARRR